MSEIPFWKVESIGNDFVLVHLDEVEKLQGSQSTDDFLRDLAIKTSSRRFGIGSDGLLAVAMEGGVLLDRMFNPDGTEDFCGNGIRCAIDHAARRGWFSPGSVQVRHLGQRVDGTIHEAPMGVAPMIEYRLPAASYRPEDIPMIRDVEAFDTNLFTIDGDTYRGSVLSTGTAHTILPVANLPDDDLFFRVSPQIEHDPMFPQRTSVMWVQQLGPLTARMRIWERGAGETLGCGTGSTAAAIDLLRRSGKGGKVEIQNPGGALVIGADSWREGPTLYGTAHEIFSGRFLL